MSGTLAERYQVVLHVDADSLSHYGDRGAARGQLLQRLYSRRFLDDQWMAVILHDAPSLARTASSAPWELISRSPMRP